MRYTILILLYNKGVGLSKTINSLYGVNDKHFHDINLIIWNNGPSKIQLDLNGDFIKKWNRVELVEMIDNMPLSHVYNYIIETYPAERYIFLDDDSKLTNEYFIAIIDSNAGVAVPAILSHGEYRSPTVSGKFNPGPYQVTDKVIAIGSGIGMSHDIAKKIKNHYGDVFDSRFALYGVDTTFFLRIHQFGLSDQVEMIDGFEHSLSRLENESQAISQFRQVERAYDLGLTLRHYVPWPQVLFILLKQTVKFALGKVSWLQLKIFIKAYKDGCHPKCINR